MLGFAGVTVRDTSVAAVTVKAVEPEAEPEVAVMMVEPEDTVDVNPLKPTALLIEATPVLDDAQVTDEVRFCVVPSE